MCVGVLNFFIFPPPLISMWLLILLGPSFFLSKMRIIATTHTLWDMTQLRWILSSEECIVLSKCLKSWLLTRGTPNRKKKKKVEEFGGPRLSTWKEDPEDRFAFRAWGPTPRPSAPPTGWDARSPQLDHSRSVMSRLKPATFRKRMRSPITDRFWKFKFISAKPRGHNGL